MAFTARVETAVQGATLGAPYNITETKPTGTIDGDILFTYVGRFSSGVSIDSVPAGWTLLASNDGGSLLESIYWKVADSEGASWLWSLSASVRHHAVCSCYTGGDFNASDPIDVVSNTPYVVSSNQTIAASMNVGAVNSPLVFWAIVGSTSSKNFTKPTVPTGDWVEDYDTGGSASDMWIEICSNLWDGSGATGDIAATISVAVTLKHAIAVALNPVVTGWAGGDIGVVPIATIAKINGVALADIVKVNGVA